MFLRQGAMVAGLGAAAGLAISWLSTPLLEQMLFEVTALDLGTTATAVGVLLAVALAATWVAARPATRVDPLETLRAE
jgi:ABC-type lipoprotein release transport system permease subunit